MSGFPAARLLTALIVAIGVLLAFSICGFELLSTARAYVAGESLWSKSRSQALAELRRALTEGSPSHPEVFRQALRRPQGIGRAHRALDASPVDVAAVRAGFLQGGIRAEDIDGMVLLYRCCARLPPLSLAIDDWSEGDRLIAELAATGEDIHAALARPGGPEPSQRAALVARLDRIDSRLTSFEEDFLEQLGAVSRFALRLLEVAVVVLGVLLATGTAGYVRRLLRRHALDQRELLEVMVAKAAAERAARARQDFLARLSHELRTPLNAVLGFSQLLLEDEPPSLRTAESVVRVRHIHDAGRHLLRLVDDVLDLTRIDSGHLAVRLESTPLGTVLASALVQVEPLRTARGLALDSPSIQPDWQVLADGGRLEQVLVNLLSNACKYNRDGGTVGVHCRRDGDQVAIDVSDQGEGLSKEEIERLFQPFQRLGRHGRTEGTGLGLSIVKRLMESMGGEVRVASEPGRGATFTVLLRATGASCTNQNAKPAAGPA